MEPGGGIEPPPDPYQGPVLPLNYPGYFLTTLFGLT